MTAPTDPLAPFRAAPPPEQRAACLHPPDDRVPLSGDGWLCAICGAGCTPPEKAAEELTGERLDEVERRAREAVADQLYATEREKLLAAAALALVAEVWRLREEATRPAPRSPEEEEAMAIIRRAAESLRTKEPTLASGEPPQAPEEPR